jgi:hypothetical protein
MTRTFRALRVDHDKVTGVHLECDGNHWDYSEQLTDAITIRY